MTECNQVAFEFAPHFSRRVLAKFSAERISSDGGSLLLREVEGRINLLQRAADCFADGRDPERVEHPVSEMLAQRMYLSTDSGVTARARRPLGRSGF